MKPEKPYDYNGPYLYKKNTIDKMQNDFMKITAQPSSKDYSNELRTLEVSVRFLLDKLNDIRDMFQSRTTLLASQQLSCLSRIDSLFSEVERLTRKTSQVERLIKARDKRDDEQEWILLANQVMDEYEKKHPPQQVATQVQPATIFIPLAKTPAAAINPYKRTTRDMPSIIMANNHSTTIQKMRSNPYNKQSIKLQSPNVKYGVLGTSNYITHPLMPVSSAGLSASVTRIIPASAINPYNKRARDMTPITMSNNHSTTMRSNPYNKQSNKPLPPDDKHYAFCNSNFITPQNSPGTVENSKNI
jgi:hypothetical protein